MDLKEFDGLLHDAEVKMKRLKALYEQWFQGIERIEPTVPRKDLERLFALLARNKPRNTAARFRLSQLTARYGIYLTYWGRIARQIEEGTYKRDLRRAARGRGTTQSTGAKTFELDLDEEIELEELVEPRDELAQMLGELERPPAPVKAKPVLSAFSPFARKPQRAPASAPEAPSTNRAEPPRPPERRRPPPPPPSTGKRPALPAKPPAPPAPPVTATFGKPKSAANAADEPNLRNLYDRYVDARRRNNENAESVAYDKLARSVRQMTTKLRERHGDKKIDFEVVVQNGKVGIKPKVG